VPGESYVPAELQGVQFYHPVARGMEAKISEKLDYLRKRNDSSEFQRYKKDH